MRLFFFLFLVFNFFHISIFSFNICPNRFSSFIEYEPFINKSLTLIEKHCNKYNIDESHNHIHSKEVLNYGIELINSAGNFTEDEIKISLLGCLFHDTIDHKYLGKDLDLDNILYNLFLSLNNKTINNSIMNITSFFIKNMSYSKTTLSKNNSIVFELPEVVKEHPYIRSYHIMRNADLLSSYNLKRALIYSSIKKNLKSRTELFYELEDFYRKRISLLRKNKILSLENNYCNHKSYILEYKTRKKLEFYRKYFIDCGRNLEWDDMLDFFDIQ